jgi:cyclohexadieny/prephenate dehydrogenase / 3-phosphoshikimate 1-carboxyvinyltransferase
MNGSPVLLREFSLSLKTLKMTQQFLAHPAKQLSGNVRVPGDKSISHRSIMLGAIADGVTEITGFLSGADALSTRNVFRQMGVKIDGPDAGKVRIEGVGLNGLKAPLEDLDCGNAGTAMRLLMGVMAGQNFSSTLFGDESLSKRPMRRVSGPLGEMGAQIDTTNGLPPVKIQGVTKLNSIQFKMPVASAQVKSAVLLAGLYAEGETQVIEPEITRDHTERMLRAFGVTVDSERRQMGEGEALVIRLRGGQRLKACKIDVPADISSAAFFLVGASISPGSNLVLEHVGVNPTRTGVLDILRLMGANIVLENQRDVGGEPVADLRVRYAPLKGLHIPEHLVPLAIDEFPVLFVAAACAEGDTIVTGAEELRVKESDRIEVMAQGLSALGISVSTQADGMRIQGQKAVKAQGSEQGTKEDTSANVPVFLPAVFKSGTVNSHGDHRIAMAFAMASLRAAGPIQILDTDNVATSFPGFVSLARQAGLLLDAS